MESSPQQVTSTGKETVLVVEDEKPVLRLIAVILGHAGYTVHCAADHAEALARAADLPRLDLLVTDVVLPVMNGKEIAARLQARHPAMKVLFVSGYTQSAIGREADLAAGDAFLQKPFTPVALTRKVRDVLDA